MKKFLLILFLCLFGFSAGATNYRPVDSRAEKTPSKYNDNLPELVKYLVEPYQNNEEKKARVIMAWIVYHVDYDRYKADRKVHNRYKTGIQTGDLFETRVGVCEDIASLYQRMAGLAGLDSVVIKGYAGTDVTFSNKSDRGHAWNAVKIDGKWEFIDTTWAMRGDVTVFDDLNSKASHDRAIKKRQNNEYKTNKARKNRTIDERWFMTEPREMIKTHYPFDEAWQLLTVPKSIGFFLKR